VRASAVWLLCYALTACNGETSSSATPLGQIVVHVDTDAPVDDQGEPSVDAPLALFDRIRFDVYAPGSTNPCDGCTNEFPVTKSMFVGGNVSMGVVVPPGQDGWSARVRLFPTGLALSSGDPNADTTLDTTIGLPPVADGRVIDVTVLLGTGDVGQPQGADAPVDPTRGPPGPSAVGTWTGAQRTACTGAAPAGMVCVPGGAFWMGSPAEDATQGTVPNWHRLVQLSPFFVDATETTVAAARAAIPAHPTYAPSSWSGTSEGATVMDWCTFTGAPGPRDALPVNCTEVAVAHVLCGAIHPGGDLPTEAQLEYLIGGLRMRPFVWGTELPSCQDAVWGRNGFGILSLYDPKTCLGFSHALGPLGGPERPGTGLRDVLTLPGGTIVDLVGNLEEWARDLYQAQTDECWAPEGVLADPYCGTPSKALGPLHVVRGGGWSVGGTLLEASKRESDAVNIVSPVVGFRCVVPGD
jgi:sulfatase modifying factor 1